MKIINGVKMIMKCINMCIIIMCSIIVCILLLLMLLLLLINRIINILEVLIISNIIIDKW